MTVLLVSVILVLMAFETFVQRALVRPILNLNRQIEQFFRGDQEIVLDRDLPVEGAQEVQALEKSLKDAFALKRANRKELAAQVAARTRELSETKNQLKSQKQLLETLWKAGNMFMIHRNLSQVAGYLLHEVLALTQSEYGFIGEVLEDEQGALFLKIHEMTDLSWNEETRDLYEKSLAEGFEFRNLNTLFGRAILTQEVVISADPATDPRSGGLPEGHPALSSFLGVPFFYGSELVGMYGLANRPGGYDEALVDYLEPFTQNYGALIFVKRMLAQQEKVLEELGRERNAAERANRAKSEFLASMSHELRTPLNSVLGFTQLLNYDDTLDEEQKESLYEIEKAGKHLLDLIDDVLDLSKVESGNIELALEPVALNGVVEESLRLIRPAADQFDVVLQMDPCEPVFVRADRVRLKQVLLNLLSNAVKYNESFARANETAKKG